MGRSSYFLKIFGGTVVPSMQVRKRKMRAIVARLSRRNAHRGGDGMTRNVSALRLPIDAGAH
jgi:hypothetical protein